MKWNKIEDGLPPAGVPLIVSVDRNINHGSPRTVLSPVYYMKSYSANAWGFFEFGDLSQQIGPDYFPVTAWAKYPDPFEG